MTISEMLSQSGLLTLLGMGVVFAFIIILILCMKLLHVILHALKLDKVESKPEKNVAVPVAPATSSVVTSAPSNDVGAVVAAISVAIREKNK